MDEKQVFFCLAEGISQLMGRKGVAEVRERALDSDEQGFSGAKLLRLEVRYADGAESRFICKRTDRKERMVMRTLTAQGRGSVPVSYTLDLDSGNAVKLSQQDGGEAAWMIQQDLGKRVGAPRGSIEWLEGVAGTLAGIHMDNLGRGAAMPWLPHADAEYWEHIVTRISVDHFEKAVREDERFARQFEGILPRLREAGRVFSRNMAALYQEADTLTLTHGDLQSLDGDHVYNVGGKPYIIDFGFARYAPLFIDLVDYFAPEQIPLCHRAYAAEGMELGLKAFEERFRAAYAYPGFIYMFPGIMQWKRGDGRKLEKGLRRILDV